MTTIDQLASALRLVRDLLDQRTADYDRRGRFYFRLGGPWRLAISPDSAGRLRVDVQRSGGACATMWTRATDHERLADLVLAARGEVLVLGKG